MMYWQREYIREGVAMTLTDTYRLDLPEHGLLGSLLLVISGAQATGYGQGGGDWRIIDKISKVEVILDGATVCKSLTGKQLAALAVLDQGVMMPDAWNNYATNTQWCYLLINFGRMLHDLDFGLDLARYNNVELRITNTAAAAQFSQLSLGVQAHYLRDASAGQFGGYMRSEEWRRWTTVAAAIQYNDLPTEHIIRRVVLQAVPAVDGSYVEKTGMHNLMEDIEFSLDTGQTRIYKGGLDELMREVYLEMGRPLIAAGSAYMTADKGVNISLGYVLGGAWGAGSQDGAGAATVATFESARSSYTQKPETYEADSPIGFVFVGMAPHLCVPFRFDQSPSPSDWLDPRGRATVQLNITTRNHADAASGVNAIVLDRLVP